MTDTATRAASLTERESLQLVRRLAHDTLARTWLIKLWVEGPSLVPGERASARKTFDPAEDFFEDRFPGNPVVPGVLLTEAMSAGDPLAMWAGRVFRELSGAARDEEDLR